MNDENNDQTVVSKQDFSSYNFNNWKKSDTNDILNEIEIKGGSIWLTSSGALSYRLSNDVPISILKNYKQANLVFSNYLNKSVLLLQEDKKKSNTKDNKKNDEGEEPNNVPVTDLKMVQSDDFNPFILKEFFKKDNLYYRNLFKPSKYLQIKPDGIQNNFNEMEVPFEAIKKLIMHLVNYDVERYFYIINWLAYFFQSLKKSQVALVLRGNQGAGKGILFNEIIKPLFGADYCMTVNDKSLRSAYLGGIVENELFFNLDEISHQKAESKSIKNFLKALITNDTITAEKKFITLDKETKIYGQVLITSNEVQVLDVEQSDRRYTIYTTGDNLMYSNYLGYTKYEELSNQIEQQLLSFAKYLKNYPVDVNRANTAEDTPEKYELQILHMKQEQEKLQRQQKDMQPTQTIKQPTAIMKFDYSIRSKEIAYFSDIKFEDEVLYNEIEEDFKTNKFKIKNLLASFQLLHGDEMRIKNVSILLKHLRTYDPQQFNPLHYKQYTEEDQTIDYISILPFIHSYQ